MPPPVRICSKPLDRGKFDADGPEVGPIDDGSGRWEEESVALETKEAEEDEFDEGSEDADEGFREERWIWRRVRRTS